MTTVTCGSVRFIDLPEYFLERYTGEINAWSNNVRKIGLVKSFILREGHLADLSPNPEQGAVLLQVKLMCRPWRGGVEIRPLEEGDKRLIARHCEKLQKAGLPSRAFTPEPPRPFLPFMPTVSVRKQ